MRRDATWKRKDGSPYRPSNGTEGEIFMAYFCDQCIHDNYPDEPLCEIIANTTVFDVDEPNYPKEWIFKNGRPLCTKFKKSL